MARSKVIAALLVLVLVAQPIAPLVGSAAASTGPASGPSATGGSADLLLDTTNDTNVTGDVDADGAPDPVKVLLGLASGYYQKAEKIESVTAQQRRNEMWLKLQKHEDVSVSMLLLYDNYIHDSMMVADMKAREEIGNAYEDGANESVAIDRSTAVVQDYYSRMAMGMIERWDAQMTQIEYVYNITENDPDITGPTGQRFLNAHHHTFRVYNNFSATRDSEVTTNLTATKITGWTYRDVELPNETMVSVKVPEVFAKAKHDDGTLYQGTVVWNPFNASSADRVTENTRWYKYTTNSGMDAYIAPRLQVQSKTLDGYYRSDTVVKGARWNDRWKAIHNKSQYITSNLYVTVNEVYPALENGTINSSDLVGPAYMVSEMSDTETVSNTSDYSLSIATLASLGLDAGNLSQVQKEVIRVKGLPYNEPAHEDETVVESTSAPPVEVDTGVELTANRTRVYSVKLVFDDGSTAIVPPDYWGRSSGSNTSVTVKDWEPENYGTKLVSHVRVTVFHNVNETVDLWVNETYTGILFSDKMPPSDGQFNIGESYQTGQVPGIQSIATMDNGIIEPKGSITLVAAYDENGNEVQSLSWEEHDYSTYDAGEIENITREMQRLQNQLIEMEERLSSGGGAGGDSSASIDFSWPSIGLPSIGGIPGSAAIVAVLVLAAILLVAAL